MEIVNPVAAEDLTAWAAVSAVSLLQPPAGDRFERRLQRMRSAWQPERRWGARADGRWVANLATEPRVLTVPAGGTGTRDVVADAVTAVGVAATHRRRGLLRQMITGSLEAAAGRGDPVSILWAAEWPIYRRFGYAPASIGHDYTLHTRGRALLGPPRGSLHTMTPEEVRTLAPAVFDAARRRYAGEVDRPAPWWPRIMGLDGFAPQDEGAVFVVHRDADSAGEADGLLVWKATSSSDLRDRMGTAEVLDLAAASDEAYHDLWAYLCGLDIVDEVTLSDRPADETIRWRLSDARALRTTAVGDSLWLRLLDVPSALSMRGYAGRDRLVLDVRDEAPGGYGAGTVVLDADGAHATCRTTDAEPDLRLDQQALAACYLGGHRLRALATGLDVAELTSGAVARFDALFATAWSPWTSTGF